MARIFTLLTISLIGSISLFAQTNKNVVLYGYSQASVSGAPPKTVIDESGKENTVAGRSSDNYFLYLAGPTATRIYPVEIWLKGERYAAKYAPIVKTPVVQEGGNIPGEKVTLVPKTARRVLKLTTTKAIGNKALAIAKNKAQSNDLVVVYKMNGKLYYAAQKRLKELEAAMRQ